MPRWVRKWCRRQRYTLAPFALQAERQQRGPISAGCANIQYKREWGHYPPRACGKRNEGSRDAPCAIETRPASRASGASRVAGEFEQRTCASPITHLEHARKQRWSHARAPPDVRACVCVCVCVCVSATGAACEYVCARQQTRWLWSVALAPLLASFARREGRRAWARASWGRAVWRQSSDAPRTIAMRVASTPKRHAITTGETRTPN